MSVDLDEKHHKVVEKMIDAMDTKAGNPSFSRAAGLVKQAICGHVVDEPEIQRPLEMAAMSVQAGTQQQVKNLAELVELLKLPDELLAKIDEECPDLDGVDDPILYIVMDAFLVQRTLGVVDTEITPERFG